MPPDDERAFFDPIRDAPNDDGPRLVYADWLDEHGQPDRAEFVRVQCALDRLPDDDPRRADVRERERRLQEAHENRWAAELAPLVTQWAFRRGVIDSVSVDAAQFLASGAAIFDLAPVRKVRFLDVGEQLAALVQSPLLRHVRELDLSNNTLGDQGPMVLARSPYLGRLDALDLGFTDLGDAGLKYLADSPALGGLRSLRLNDNPGLGPAGVRAVAESAHQGELADLDLSGNGLSDAVLRPLLDGPPGRRLARLVLQGNRLGNDGTAALVRSLVFTRMAERDGMIDLRRVEMGPAGARALADCPALRAVDSLDLEGNVLGDAGLAALAASPYLTHLRVLSLRENRITDDGVRALARSPAMATLRVLDLTGNLITQDSQDRLHEASVAHDWRGLLQLKVDSQLRTRPLGVGPLGGFFRRPQP
jgi:uncharacterized protein (TIGR02996 family)